MAEGFCFEIDVSKVRYFERGNWQGWLYRAAVYSTMRKFPFFGECDSIQDLARKVVEEYSRIKEKSGRTQEEAGVILENGAYVPNIPGGIHCLDGVGKVGQEARLSLNECADLYKLVQDCLQPKNEKK